ncbi:F-type H+-transporting ATPase subunit b [Prevotella aff. ruminicola Tc2-24]|jgi:F-type H+-transporting ATPase subunit b|uniref:ATP synthase subunit b n=1 Tax=Prevotella aff. ruminicola Tc2-24 TaxID=81582 RepID=A0A1I0M512_9BACT|nr:MULTISPECIES: F0F1 ATP synthase subunit B [Prevotella]MBR5988634.1 F0F1 ATP synthase subunit B [Prevotella sp.]SEE04945.1 F-type H+-transporting ATPase subunit b [Prevotella sp. lc2012]SEV83555.1 F-type H+-transporting ATPase subunit b [Prevotella aff. ruminicola Tc2-24]
MDSINLPSILTPDFGLFFWMFVAFLVVFLLLAKFGFPVITHMVEERKNYIDESLRKAHEAQERLANIEKEGESILQEAREKQAQILKEAAETRDAIVEKAQEKAKSEGARLLDDARNAIEQEKKAAIADIRAQVATLSVEIAEKVLKQNLKDDQSQMDLIDRMLDDISSTH